MSRAFRFPVGGARPALWFGIEEFRHVERVAVVTDPALVRLALALSGRFVPGHVRLFATAERPAAETWIREA